jgi:hypothetical protein
MKQMTKKVLAVLCLGAFLISCKPLLKASKWANCIDEKCSEKCREKDFIGGNSPQYDKEARVIQCLCYPREGDTKTFYFNFEEIDCKRK